MSAGLQTLAALIQTQSRDLFRSMSEQFFTEDEQPAWRFFCQYADQYGAFPTLEVMQQNGFTLPQPAGTAQYHRDQLQNRFSYNLWMQSSEEFFQYVQAGHMSEARDVLETILTRWRGAETVRDTFTLQEAMQMVVEDYHEAQRLHGRLRGITYGWDVLDEKTGGCRPGDVTTIVARPGAGKAQPLSEPVLLATGQWIRMGDLSVGDELASPTGARSVVEGIFPQGTKRVFEVTFRDGRRAQCCEDHLWEVKSARWNAPRVVDTREMVRLHSCIRHHGRLSVRMVSGYFGLPWTETLSPYALGALLGDGGMTANFVSFHTADEEMLRIMESELPPLHGLRYLGNYDYRVTNFRTTARGANQVMAFLKRSGLHGKKSTEKFIPDFVFTADRQSRLSVLQGLMDTDGTVTKRTPVFASASERLAKDVQRLVWSLGGSARMSFKKNDHAGCWSVFIRMPDPSCMFRLSRKRQQAVKTQYSDRLRLTITDIQEVGYEPCQCIKVSDPDNLYVTRDYVVTHNTFTILKMAAHAWQTGNPVVVVSMEMGAMEIARRVLSIGSGVSADFIQRGTLSEWGEEVMMASVERVEHMPPFHLLIGNLSKSVRDVDMLIQEHAPGAVFVDAGYLLNPASKRQGMRRFELAADTIRELKDLAMKRNKPIIQTVQFNRQQKADEDMSIDNIGQTDEIGQISSLVIGMKKGATPNESIRRRYTILKNRHGEDHWSFETNFLHTPFNMDVIEEEEGTADDLDDYDGTQGPQPVTDEWSMV